MSTASEMVNTVGKQFAQPLALRKRDGSYKKHLLKKIVNDRSLDTRCILSRWLQRYAELQVPEFENTFVRSDYRDALRGLSDNVSLIYADPPYTRDHYSRYYHVLETMSLYDNPAISLVEDRAGPKLSRGIYRTERHQSPFCIRSQARDAFVELFEAVRTLNVPLVLSYSPYSESRGERPRLLLMDQLVALAKTYFGNVEVVSAGQVSHNRLNHSELNVPASEEAERFLVCIPTGF